MMKNMNEEQEQVKNSMKREEKIKQKIDHLSEYQAKELLKYIVLKLGVSLGEVETIVDMGGLTKEDVKNYPHDHHPLEKDSIEIMHEVMKSTIDNR